jgi:hypothetical protein
MPSAGFEPKIPASEPYTFRFYKEVPKEIITLASQGLATANNIVRCFSLHLAKSAVWITVKQAIIFRCFFTEAWPVRTAAIVPS